MIKSPPTIGIPPWVTMGDRLLKIIEKRNKTMHELQSYKIRGLEND